MNKHTCALALVVVALTGPGITAQEPPSPRAPLAEEQGKMQHLYVGMWVTADGHIRQELLANGRYDEARGTQENAYQGRYEVDGNMIFYWDDTGFTANGEFVSNNELHHGGMIFYRRD